MQRKSEPNLLASNSTKEGATSNPATTAAAAITSPSQSAVPQHGKFVTELRQRDLRRLERIGLREEPYILIRRHAVVMSMGPLVRAIIQADRLILIVHQDAGNQLALDQLERHIDGNNYIPPSFSHLIFLYWG